MSTSAESLRRNAERGVELAGEVLKGDERGELDDGVVFERALEPRHQRVVHPGAEAGYCFGYANAAFPRVLNNGEYSKSFKASSFASGTWRSSATAELRSTQNSHQLIDRHTGFHHLHVMNAAPQMAPPRHVARLAGFALARMAARLPLFVGAFQELAVQRETLCRKLMAQRAKARIFKCGVTGPAVVRKTGRRIGRGTVTARRTVAPMSAHVAGGAGEALFVRPPRRISRGVRPDRSCRSERCNQAVSLLLERRVTAQTILMLFRSVGGHVDQLSGPARPHRAAVQTFVPVVELVRVASTAWTWIKGRLERTGLGRRRALRCERARPVLLEEPVDLVGVLRLVRAMTAEKREARPKRSTRRHARSVTTDVLVRSGFCMVTFECRLFSQAWARTH